MKKIYKEPKEIVIELGLQGQLLDVSGNGPNPENGGNLDGSGDGQGNGEDMSARTHGNLWDGQW